MRVRHAFHSATAISLSLNKYYPKKAKARERQQSACAGAFYPLHVGLALSWHVNDIRFARSTLPPWHPLTTYITEPRHIFIWEFIINFRELEKIIIWTRSRHPIDILVNPAAFGSYTDNETDPLRPKKKEIRNMSTPKQSPVVKKRLSTFDQFRRFTTDACKCLQFCSFWNRQLSPQSKRLNSRCSRYTSSFPRITNHLKKKKDTIRKH